MREIVRKLARTAHLSVAGVDKIVAALAAALVDDEEFQEFLIREALREESAQN